ncbi:MAG: hypothetical protein EON59_02290, partial [Alphaproteobacteria bacterium]
MKRLFKFLVAMVAFVSSSVAFAQASNWTVSEAAGQVMVRDASGERRAQRGAVVAAGALVATGPGAKAVLVRGKDFVTVAANSRVRIPLAVQKRGMFEIIQEWGNAIFQIEKKPNPHFGVQTKYLAAVVKGTTFSITVSEEGASLQVLEGAVQTSTIDGGASELIRPGIIAIVSASDQLRLTVKGQDTRTIDSPQRSTPNGPAPSDQEAPGSQGNEASDATAGSVSEGALGNQVITEPIVATMVDLSGA